MDQPDRSILVIEDNEPSREALVSLLASRFPGVNIYSAGDGRTGLDCFARRQSAVIITDVSLPDLDGIEVIGRIRATHPATGIIVVTAHHDLPLSVIHAEKHGPVEYVVKPVNLDVLFATVSRFLKNNL